MSELLVVTGPTATGKTALAVQIALRTGGEVISADSMQIYRRMDIGTAKPTAEEMHGVPHHMLDVAEPGENFSAARYAEMASACVDDILARGRLPIVAGGTGLYIEGLLRGTEYAAAPADSALRSRLEEEYDTMGGAAFRDRLRQVDPERAQILAERDKKRLVRAWEIYCLTGRTITEHDRESRQRAPRYTALTYVLDYEDRQQLYDRIDRRAAKMFELGLVDEVRALMDANVPMDGTAMQAIGYKQTVDYLRGECTLQQAVELVQLRSRQYAKRQLTWLRRDPDARWIRWKQQPDSEILERTADEIVREMAKNR